RARPIPFGYEVGRIAKAGHFYKFINPTSATKGCNPGGVIMRHLRLKLATRIYSGFGVALLFAVGIAAFGAVGLLSIESRVETMSMLADGNARALQITNDLEVMRRAALRFKLDGAEEAVREGAEASSRIRGMIQSVAAASGSRARREIYENAALALDEFQKQREALIGLGRSLGEERAKLDAGASI
ncbi:hypothetical protein, partial [Rhodoplanes elegans]|uniref:hypothetical protein n=1 Tax=Rhodoplanes elegans TaxID=29408 RepID=UPI001AEC92C4